jgi:hypothetical protein
MHKETGDIYEMRVTADEGSEEFLLETVQDIGDGPQVFRPVGSYMLNNPETKTSCCWFDYTMPFDFEFIGIL